MEKRGVTLTQMALLQLIKQNKSEGSPSAEYLSNNLSDEDVKFFEDNEFITTVKPKRKSDTVYDLLRTTKKGNQFLEEVETEGVTEDDLKLYEVLKTIYQEEGKELGNQKRTKQFMAQFRVQSGIERNELFTLCREFIEDEENFKYSIRLEYVFFKGASAFDTKFSIDQSRLYQYYLKREEYFQELFKQL